MLRGHPADATQIQRVAVPTPHNGIPLKRFFSAIAIVKKLTRKSSIIFAGQPHLNPLLQATMLRSPLLTPPKFNIGPYECPAIASR